MSKALTADPYRDLAVVDARAPRFNQAVVAALAGLGAMTGLWWLYALPALQLTVGLALGRRWCLPCVFYFQVIQPRLGEGPLEDSRPPRFANQVGAVLLWSSTLAALTGWPQLARLPGTAVAALALLSAVTGLCLGCSLYRLGAGLRGVRSLRLCSIDLAELGVPAGQPAVVQFTHPLCSDCHELTRRLVARGTPPVLVDVSRRADLARRYGVAVVPLAFETDGAGRVLRAV
ncbi:MAG TPA: DUF4395 family protein [Anaeromyxobacter sp.]|nr:DUF4395 family protein [Anaeromyxobacter sp.]